MSEQNGQGYNGRYTAQQFIKAIPGTGGSITKLAQNLECAWNTARDGIERWPTVKRAWLNERHRITDCARSNVVSAIEDDHDLPTSKWWLQAMDPEFAPRQQAEVKVSGVLQLVEISDMDFDAIRQALIKQDSGGSPEG